MSSSAGKVLLIPKGTYDSNTTYQVLDWVLYQGRPYVAKQTTTGNLPTDTTYWQLLLDFPINVDSAPTENSNNLVSSGGVYSALGSKQDNLTFDSSPTQNSDNPVKSGGVYTALAGKQNTLTFDNAPTQNSDNPVKSGGVYTALGNKQDTLTFDNSPTQNSNNPVKSGGVYSALAGKQNNLTFDNAPTQNSDNPVKSGGVYSALAGKQNTLTFDNTPTQNSNNPVKSGGVYSALQNAGHTIKDETTAYTKRANLQFKGFKVTDDSANNSTVVEIPLDPSTVSWANGSDEDIATMLEMHYNGEIDIHDYWSVGDERVVSLAAMDAMSPLNDTHVAQSVVMVLLNEGGKNLTTPINGHTSCAFVVGQKNCLDEYGFMGSAKTNAIAWRDCARRTWCNSTYKNALPSNIRALFKEYQNITALGNGNTPITTNDYFAFASEMEVFGVVNEANSTAEASNTQFEYYETAANRIKKRGNSNAGWWLRSPGKTTEGYNCAVWDSGNVGSANFAWGGSLAPIGCI